jgi:hypothetical protein
LNASRLDFGENGTSNPELQNTITRRKETGPNTDMIIENQQSV